MVNFPITRDNNASLYLVANNKRTRLLSSITSSALTIPVVTTSGFPTSGFVTIRPDPTDITKDEAIKYSNTTATTFVATQRGAGGTPASAHPAGRAVELNFVAEHHNDPKDAVVKLEHFVGISGAKNFLPMNPITGDVVVTGTATVSGGSTFSFVTVTGSLIGNTGFFTTSLTSPVVSGTTVNANTLNVPGRTIMTGNLTVTGTATLGTLVVTGTVTATGTSRFIGDMSVDNQIQVGRPAWADADLLTAYNDTTQTIPTASYTFANVQTDPTLSGVDYLVMYQGHGGSIAVSPEKVPDLRLMHGGVELAQHQRRGLQNSSSPSPQGLAFAMHGFTVVSGNGERLYMQHKATGSFISDTRVNALAIIAWPLTGRFRRDIDYFYDVRNSSTFGSTLPTTFGNPSNTLLSTTFNIPETGTYLFFAMAESNTPSGAASTNGSRFRFLVDGIYQRTEFVIQANSHGTTSLGENLGVMNIARLTNLTKGNHTFAVQGASRVSTTSSFRRPRIFVIKESAVQQVQRTTASPSVSINNSGNYFTLGLSVTYTPKTTEKVLVFSHMLPGTTSVQNHPVTQITNITRGEIYRADAGTVGALTTASTDASAESHVMWHLLPMSSGVPNTVTVSGKTNPIGFAGTTSWGFQPASGTSVDRELWMMSTTSTFDPGPEWVTISGKTVATDTLLAGIVQASSLRLTVSGAVVSTGTSYPVESLNSARGIVTVTGVGRFHTTTSGQLITVSGEPPDAIPDPINVSTVNAATSLTISGVPVVTGTLVIPDPLNLNTVNAAISLTISGVPVVTSVIPNSLNIGTVAASTSLTVSGVPVITGTLVTSLNSLVNAVTLAGAGAVSVFPSGQTVTISGNAGAIPSPVTLNTATVTGSLTISGVPVVTGTGETLSSLNALQNRVTVAGTGSVNVLTSGQAITLSGNPASVPDPLTVGTLNVSNSLTLSGVPVVTGTNAVVVLGGLSGNQTTGLSTRVRWDFKPANFSNFIVFNTTNNADRGTISILPGYTYEIFCQIHPTFSGSSPLGHVTIAIRNVTGDTTGCAFPSSVYSTTHTGHNSGISTAIAIVTPPIPSDYEVQILSGDRLTNLNTLSWCRVRAL